MGSFEHPSRIQCTYGLIGNLMQVNSINPNVNPWILSNYMDATLRQCYWINPKVYRWYPPPPPPPPPPTHTHTHTHTHTNTTHPFTKTQYPKTNPTCVYTSYSVYLNMHLDYGNAIDVFTIVIVNMASHSYPAYRGRLQTNMFFFDVYQANMQSADWFGNIILLISTPKELLS